MDMNLTDEILVKVFVLDDDDSFVYKLKQAFDKIGKMNYEMFDRQETFFEHFSKQVHIAIIDHSLDGMMNGYDVMKQVFAINPACHVIIISGYTDAKLILKYYNNGAFRYVLKDDSDFITSIIEGVTAAFQKINSLLTFYKDQIERLALIKKVYA